METGKATEADLDKLLDLCDNIMGRSFCALADGAVSPVASSIKYFRDEYIAHITNKGCPFDPMASNLFAGAQA
jgi:NADH-quinone oxidoreductase subunit F